MVVDVSTIIASVVVVIGTIITVYEILEMKKARHAEATLALFAEMDKEGFREDRRKVFELTPETKLTGKVKDSAEMVWVTMNHLAVMVQEGILPKHLVLRVYAGTVALTWKRLERFIKVQRGQRKDDKYMKPYEELAHECLDYWKKEHSGREPESFADGT
jgi:hypothetical protein